MADEESQTPPSDDDPIDNDPEDSKADVTVANGLDVAGGEGQDGAKRAALERQLGRTEARVVGLGGKSAKENQADGDEGAQEHNQGLLEPAA